MHRLLNHVKNDIYHRGVAQSGSASALGAEGRRFKSCLPDIKKERISHDPFFFIKAGFELSKRLVLNAFGI